MYHTKEEKATLACGIQSLNGPDWTYFEWKKNNELFSSFSAANSTSFSLETSQLLYPFGEFECLVGNGFFNAVERIYISETGMISRQNRNHNPQFNSMFCLLGLCSSAGVCTSTCRHSK